MPKSKRSTTSKQLELPSKERAVKKPKPPSLQDLKPGGFVLVAYKAAPGRLPGVFGAEVVAASKDSKYANIKVLFPDRPPKPAMLKLLGEAVVDAADNREVSFSFPNEADEKRLQQWKQNYEANSLASNPPRLGDILAFIYPEPPDGYSWEAGPWIGSLSFIAKKPDHEGNLNCQVVFYYRDAEHDIGIEVAPFIRTPKGEWIETKSVIRMVKVRRATPGEIARYAVDRNRAAREIALPNPAPPKSSRGGG